MATAAKILRSPVRLVLAAVKARLVLKAAASSDQIWIVRRRRGKQPSFIADVQLLVGVSGMLPSMDIAAAAGRVVGVVTRKLHVTVRTRNDLDEAEKDETRLLDAAAGHYYREELVADALHMFWPEDTAGSNLTIKPIRLLPCGEAEQEDSKESSWTASVLEFEVSYMLDVNQKEQ